MTFGHSLKTALAGLRTHKTRSLLTILGIVIGVTSIILVMAIVQGAGELILSQVEGLGSRTIAVVPGREPSGPSDIAQIFSDSLKERDLELLRRKENAPNISRIMPVVFGGENALWGKETYRLTIFGASEEASELFEIFPQEGTFFSESEVRGSQAVVVIGAKVKEELFGDNEALGERIKIKGKNFRVIGVLPKKGQISFFNFDDMAVMPYTTAKEAIFGIKYFHRFIVQADSEENVSRTVEDIEETLRSSHGITDPTKDDFFVETQADLAARLSTITDVLTLLLVSIAAISLLVGGIGIMNIMLVSVTERTREIGLRKAIGATNRDILTQFLLEAVILTGLGGLAGIFLGAILSVAVGFILSQFVGLPWAFSFPALAAFLGLLVSGAVGLVFGIYPARQASLKSPIEALRYE
ncbi:hypothetical protein A2757_01705 [Candidatus Giovannonibacteria bacterium RIFCSPHIGHO2_01_FULL_48_47]|nr:MAG: hypothetical protein A2757_01705 [Candidatus Giovannonibacteria bacterium RIFCSPHIGHO2_01_FULL_48_47]OGF68418.1 MAG: hypothetical protein A3D61_00900 [Candidatus Giovannonibacteria bacterium RIFCSPHIGHO2_02_FULL_48_15]OGF88754.1 MAG: hypothetical protein A3B26_02990 [Candidatus Giovannonibacteria bacterium RIFCSPLOWO2_01_FULL_48_47]OGF96125.1 MAG: hypothetical protein A2613_00965 [Candidatus Giovannonibacteria bacterium RIFOXYD1_FULL_48_21]HBT81352.1 multidrug ABC transporter substrate-